MIIFFNGCELPMTNADKLKQEELEELQNVEVTHEEFNLEDLIVLGDDKKIPIHITFPNTDGSRSEAKALVKQLTLRELDNVKLNDNPLTANLVILERALFKQDGTNFNRKEIEILPLGVVNAIANKILELSGVDIPGQPNLQNF